MPRAQHIRIPCRCENCHRISYEREEPKNPDWWFCSECKGQPGDVSVADDDWESRQ